MTKRLLILPAVAVVCAAVWVSGLVWPIATQTWSVLAPRPHAAYDEDDVTA